MPALSPRRTWSAAWTLALALAWAPPAHAIGNGTTTGSPRAVVRIEMKLDDGTYGVCSGTLVTPNWVLTANHCVTGRQLPCLTGAFIDEINLDPSCIGPNPASDCFVVEFPPAGSSDANHPDAVHRRGVEVFALADDDEPVNMCDGDMVERDMALIRLRSATDPDVQPIHPPILDGNECPDSGDFTARIMGYGPNEFDFEGPDGLVRRYYEDGGWHRNTSIPDDGVYYKAWNLGPYLPGLEWVIATTPAGIFASSVALDALLNYDGMHGGDSGGPILHTDDSWTDPDDLAVCGTASRSWVEINWAWDGMCFPSPGCAMMQVANHYAALDNDDAQDFLTEHLVVGGAFDCESGPDSDGDGAVDDCDACPDGDDFVDSDEDGRPDGCDICPGHDDAEDSDGDGVPSGCDPCLDDGQIDMFDKDDNSWGDWDNDGRCNSIDNCPYVANALQTNRNVAWEVAHDLAIWGDACDPSPTADLDSPEPQVLDDSQAALGWTVYAGAGMELTGMKSRPAPDGVIDPTTSLVVNDVLTDVRFCQGDPSMDCVDAENLDEAELRDWEPQGTDYPGRPWHPVQLDGYDLGEPVELDYNDVSTVSTSWDYLADHTRWTTEGILEVEPNDLPIGTDALNLDGYFWLHGRTDVGIVSAGTGVHGVEGRNVVVAFDPEWIAQQTLDIPELGLPWFLDFYWLGDPPDFLDLALDHVAHEVGRSALVQTKAGVGLLRDGGVALDLSDTLGAALSASFTASYVWSGAADPPGEDDALALALDAEGTGLAELVLRDGDQLLGIDDAGARPALLGAAGPGADRGFSTVYSPGLRSIYRVGGASRELWRGDLAFGSWVKLADDVGDVLAATASAGDARLYALRRVERGAQLVAFDAMTGAETVLAAWERGPQEGSTFALTPDGDGALLLTAQSATGYWAVLRVEPDRGEPPSLLDWDAGSLRGAPLVGDARALLYVVDRDGTAAAELDLGVAGEPLRSWDELAEVF